MVLFSSEEIYQESTCVEQSDLEQVAEHLSITEAGDLLDWLEGQGIHSHHVCIDPEGRMTVSWIC